jgi:ketosteroid isomerase-like protein
MPMGPITRLTRRVYVGGLRCVERGDIDGVLRLFDDRCRLTFVGDSPLGTELSTRGDIRRWFERFGRLLPNPRFEIQRLVVSGPPWNQRLAAHVVIHGTIGGEPYRNQFAHFLVLRWGKAVEDLVIEDTQMWERACRRLVEVGVAEAAEGPLSPSATPTGVGTRR